MRITLKTLDCIALSKVVYNSTKDEYYVKESLTIISFTLVNIGGTYYSSVPIEWLCCGKIKHMLMSW